MYIPSPHGFIEIAQSCRFPRFLKKEGPLIITAGTPFSIHRFIFSRITHTRARAHTLFSTAVLHTWSATRVCVRALSALGIGVRLHSGDKEMRTGGVGRGHVHGVLVLSASENQSVSQSLSQVTERAFC